MPQLRGFTNQVPSEANVVDICTQGVMSSECASLGENWQRAQGFPGRRYIL